MKTLLIGGTGLISTGIVKHLLARAQRDGGGEVWMLNRGRRENTLPPSVKAIIGDRSDDAVLAEAAAKGFDVVIDMVCFDPATCRQTLEAFAGKTKHFIFCSTVCTYGVKVPPGVLVDETFPQEPISGYGRNKVACEQLCLEYAVKKKFETTIIRPSHTYGPGSAMIDMLQGEGLSWDRAMKNRPLMIADGGLGLWVSTHRDDCGKAFAYAALNPKTYGQAYNATRDTQLTWLDTYRHILAALGARARLISMPAEWIWRHDEKRFGLLREITAFHGAYSSEKAKRDIPEYRCEIDLTTGAKETFADMRRRNAWKTSDNDHVYNQMVEEALKLGAPMIEV